MAVALITTACRCVDAERMKAVYGLKDSDDKNIKLFSSLLLVPRAYQADSPYATA